MVRILLADAQYLVREGLKSILAHQPDMQIVGEVADEKAMLSAIGQYLPDLIILDHDTLQFYSDHRWPDFLDLASQHRFLIISQDHDRSRITNMLEQGINTILTKYCDEDEIVNAIRASMKGEKYFCTKVLDILVDSVREDSRDTCAPTCLTAREAEIVQLIASGCKTRDVAEKLHLSPHTINTNRKNIFKKLGIRSGNELILYALNTGLITTPRPKGTDRTARLRAVGR